MGKRKKLKRPLARRDPRVLVESASAVPVNVLTEQFISALEIVEAREDGRLRVRGEFARCGVATENKRVYPGHLWEREIGRLGTHFAERKVYGELDHPDDGRTRLSRVSHIVTALKVEDGVVVGEAEILDTAKGRDLAALLRAGCKVGVSSRGYGTTKPNEMGEQVVQSDYRLATFDFVADPADSTAYPEIFSESTEPGDLLFEGLEIAMADNKTLTEDQAVTKEALREEVAAELYDELTEMREQIESELRTEITAELTEQLSEQFEERETALTEELTEARDLIEALQEQNTKLANATREIGFKWYLERRVSGHPQADAVRSLVGDVAEYATADAFKAKIESVVEEIDRQKQLEEERAQERRLMQERALEERKRLEEENAQLHEAVGKLAEVTRVMTTKVYAEERLSRHPKADSIRRILERLEPKTKEEVDEIIEEFRAPVRSREEIERSTARVREAMGGGISALAADEEEPWKEQPRPRALGEDTRGATGNGAGFNGLGVALNEIRRYMPETDQY